VSEGSPPRGLILAAPHSGSGKTIVTLGLLRALKRRGLGVAAAKAGPDYIDAAFLAAADRSARGRAAEAAPPIRPPRSAADGGLICLGPSRRAPCRRRRPC